MEGLLEFIAGLKKQGKKLAVVSSTSTRLIVVALNLSLIHILQEKCGQLKPPYDEIAKLYFCEERPASEIAELKQKNLKTVQTQIYRARAMLRKLYGKERS